MPTPCMLFCTLGSPCLLYSPARPLFKGRHRKAMTVHQAGRLHVHHTAFDHVSPCPHFPMAFLLFRLNFPDLTDRRAIWNVIHMDVGACNGSASRRIGLFFHPRFLDGTAEHPDGADRPAVLKSPMNRPGHVDSCLSLPGVEPRVLSHQSALLRDTGLVRAIRNGQSALHHIATRVTSRTNGKGCAYGWRCVRVPIRTPSRNRA